jgi:hypothetical protein
MTKITKMDFMALCGELFILEDIALETPEVIHAIKNGANYDELKQVLTELF